MQTKSNLKHTIRTILKQIEQILEDNLPDFITVRYEICRRCWFAEKCTEWCEISDYVRELFEEYKENVKNEIKNLFENIIRDSK